ncbi:putative aminotransferase family protein [Daldinia caldariorum]|uniref:putative aminotransferase family protein n=1 Tax=Daldinia caldariorum TaxID=326644 RepID=UPI002007CC84|nr:putative aminotransferase family protein [Daldinia caldariorum]KAI1470547.1 putative aminotransferase family protein [Daldinia caldariorum]
MTIIHHSEEGQEATMQVAETSQVPFGAAFRKAHFAFGPNYTPLNHGSYGTIPVSVRRAHEQFRAEADAAPDPFIALEFHDRLAAQRALAARALNCANVDELVFVPNATTGSDTVLKNLDWRDGDVILCYERVYDSLGRGISWVEETRGVEVHVVRVAWSLADDELVRAMVDAARRVNADPRRRRRMRLAVVDTVVSMPGFRVPFERLVPALRAEGALVLVDGAHGIGHVDIDLSALDPDFFVTNLHKWFFVPRGCAALYVPVRNQHLIRTTLPTSHKFRPRKELGSRQTTEGEEGEARLFAEMFDFTGTDDTTAWLCVQAAIDFRDKVCGGDAAIKKYCHDVAQRSAEAAAEILGTSIMDTPGSCMRDCFFANVRLPLELGTDGSGKVDPAHADKVCDWFKETGSRESGIYFQTEFYRNVWWWRLSGMVYVDVDDFIRGAEVLKGLCERVRNGEHVKG